MELALMTLTALLLGALAMYAQLVIPSYAASSGEVMLTRVALLATGLALGLVSSTIYIPDDPLRALLFFLIGFGTVHFPAACILFIKRVQRAGKVRDEC